METNPGEGGARPPYICWHDGNKLEINYETSEVRVNGEVRTLVPRLYKTLVLFADRTKKIVSKNRLSSVAKTPRANSRGVKVNVSNLKSALPEFRGAIFNHHGEGYSWNPDGVR